MPIGNSKIQSYKKNDTDIQTIYLGNTKIWSYIKINPYPYTFEQGIMNKSTPSAWDKGIRTQQALFFEAGTYQFDITTNTMRWLKYMLTFHSQSYETNQGTSNSYIGYTGDRWLDTLKITDGQFRFTYTVPSDRYIQLTFVDTDYITMFPNYINSLTITKIS